MATTPSFKGIRSSRYEEGKPIGDSSSHVDKNYCFSKRINRIQEKKQIKYLFEELTKIEGSEYYGRISGIEIKIDFSLNHPSFVYAKNEEDLKTAYGRILDVLIKRN